MTHPATRPAHHPHGPSAIGNPCNAAWKLSQHAPPVPASADADEGTLLHSLIANPEPAKLAELDAEQAMAVGQCLTQSEAWAKDSPGCLRPYHEQMLSLYDDAGDLVNFGTLDFLAISPDNRRAILADWKFGRNASPLVADQLACYAAMAFQAHPDLLAIDAHAWYPRAPRHSQCWQYSRDDLPRLIEAIKARIAIRESRERWEFVTGDHCHYCPAALICGARRRELATVESAAITVESLSPADIAELLPRLKRLDKIAAAIKDRAKVLAGSGELPGWRLVDVRGREALTGTVLDHAAALQMAGFTDAQVWECAEIDLAKAREIASNMPMPPGIKSKPADYHLAALAPFIGRGAGYQKMVETKETP